jgi:hypothetical protein
MIRFASTVLASLSLALIVLAAISGGEAKAMGVFYCGGYVVATGTCSSGCTFGNTCSADGQFTLPLLVPNGAQCYCWTLNNPT